MTLAENGAPPVWGGRESATFDRSTIADGGDEALVDSYVYKMFKDGVTPHC